jgi:signal peptidase I
MGAIIMSNTGYQPEPSPKTELWEEALSWAKTVVFAVVFALLVNQFVIVNASVPTGSMEETIQVNDRIVAFRLSYLMSEPQRYDIVVFRYPDDESTLYVKRIMGLPGETVEIQNGLIFINGSGTALRDEFIKGPDYDSYGPFEVPEGHYFMVGDNRGNSRDSRHWNNTFVDERKILGKVIFKYFPGFKNFIRNSNYQRGGN